MKKTAMTKTSRNSKIFRASAIFAALLMVLLPTTGVGGFSSIAYAVSADADTSLAEFTVDGQAVSDGSVINVDYGTTSVDVVATPTVIGTDETDSASVEINGDSGLISGPNTLTAVVTAADDVTTETYTVTVNVGYNNDSSLGVFTVNGDDVVDGGTVNLDYGTTAVEVIAEPSAVDATLVVSGNTGLVEGTNSLVVVVTAADGSDTTYRVTLVVSESADSSLGVFTVNGDDVTDGGTVNLDYGTTSVDVIAEPAAIDATVEITGDAELVTGVNELVVVVTAADGSTSTYRVTLVVERNSDVSLAVFTVNGDDAYDGYVANVSNGTTSVDIIAESSDPDARVEVIGNSNLQEGENDISVKVTAADTESVSTLHVKVIVAGPTGDEFSNDTTLSTFKVDGVDVTDGQDFRIAQGRSSVSVEAVPTNALATAVTAGNTNLRAGESNDVTVTVTADDATVRVYHIYVIVAVPSSDASIATIQINGATFAGDLDGTGIFNALYGSTQVTVVATPTSNTAIVSVTGNTELETGDNLVSIHVVAEDGTPADYSFKVVVAAANTNTDLSTFKVNGSEVSDSQIIELPYATSGVTVEAITSSETSTFTIDGTTGLTTGDQTLTVAVKAQSGASYLHQVTLRVLSPSSDKTINSITLNGQAVLYPLVVLPAGSTTASFVVELASPFARYTVSGDGTLSNGNNEITITVTAQDESTFEKLINVYVPVISTDNTLSGITVDDEPVDVDGTVNRVYGT
ncbi:MAG: hypothetical protein EBS85_01885, partial [Micrococcales bacterium]|nr:hypothetical protein [Micrococcales bacterium]